MEEHNSTEGKTLQVCCLVKGNVLKHTASNAWVFKACTDVCPCDYTEGLHGHNVFKRVCAESGPWEKTLSLHGGVSQQHVRSDTEPAELNPHSRAPQTKLSPLNP